MKKLLPVLILGSALSACASSSGYNDSYNDRPGYSGDEYVEYQGRTVRKTPAYIECESRDDDNRLIGASAAASVALANKSCKEYLEARYQVPRYDPYATSTPGTILPTYTYGAR